MALLSKPGLIPLKIENNGALITTQVNKINFSGAVTGSMGNFNDLTIQIGLAPSSSYSLFAVSSSYASNGGVTQIVAGTNVTISPSNGLGVVTINSTGAGTGSGVPIGPVYSIQYNNFGAFSGSGNFTISGSTPAVYLTGSLNVSGSTLQTGNNTLLGNTLLTGSIIISGSTTTPVTPTIKIYGDVETNGVIKFDPVVKNIDTTVTGSYIYVSGSTNDLYFSQNGSGYNNVTRLRWLEGNLYTGLLDGALITSASTTTFSVSSGSGIVVDLNASLTDNPYPIIQYVNWGNITGQTLTYLTSSVQTFIGIDATGSIIQQTSPWNDGQFNTSIQIGTVLHQNKSTINGTLAYPNVAYGWKQRSYDFIRAFGPLKLSGYTLFTSSSLGLTVGNGIAFAEGRNYQTDPNNPSYVTDAGTNISKIFRYYQSGSEFIQDTNSGSGYTVIDPANYNPSASGVLTSVSPSKFTIQRVFWYPNSTTKGIVVYYGNTEYSTVDEGIANIAVETFSEVENTKQNAVYLGAIVIKGNATFLSTVNVDYEIVAGGLFRATLGGGGGGGGGSALPAFPYTGSAGISGSLYVVGPITGSSFTGSFTGSLFGTSSFAASSSFSSTSSFPWFKTGSNIAYFGGNVGIGTNIPSAKFQIIGSGTTSATNALLIQNANTSASFTVRDDGYVGIGTNAPNSQLEVMTGANAIRFGGSNGRTLLAYTSGSLSNFDFYAVQTYFNSDFLIEGGKKISTANGSTANLYLTTNDVTKSIYIDRSVGILTSSPSASLDVSGSVRITNGLIVTSSVIANSFTGSLQGTSSWASNAISSSYTLTASLAPLYVLTSATSSMLAPYLLTSRTSSFTTTGSNTFIGTQTVSGSVNITGSLNTVGPVTQSNGGNSLSSYQEIIYSPGGVAGGGIPTTVITKTGGNPMSMFIEYQLINTITLTDQRSGYIMANFNSSGTPTSTFTETVTADIGNTSMVNFTTNGSPNYDIIATNGGATPYTFKAILRYF